MLGFVVVAAAQGLAAGTILVDGSKGVMPLVAVVFGVNASVPVAGLTEHQICDVYAGRITNWKELGGPDLAIAPRAVQSGRPAAIELASRGARS